MTKTDVTPRKLAYYSQITAASNPIISRNSIGFDKNLAV